MHTFQPIKIEYSDRPRYNEIKLNWILIILWFDLSVIVSGESAGEDPDEIPEDRPNRAGFAGEKPVSGKIATRNMFKSSASLCKNHPKFLSYHHFSYVRTCDSENEIM